MTRLALPPPAPPEASSRSGRVAAAEGCCHGTGARETPALVADLDDAYALDSGDSTFCALSRSRGLLCWGNNGNRQVGDGTSELRDRPTPVVVVD